MRAGFFHGQIARAAPAEREGFGNAAACGHRYFQLRRLDNAILKGLKRRVDRGKHLLFLVEDLFKFLVRAFLFQVSIPVDDVALLRVCMCMSGCYIIISSKKGAYYYYLALAQQAKPHHAQPDGAFLRER
jgi:hypothetical protein